MHKLLLRKHQSSIFHRLRDAIRRHPKLRASPPSARNRRFYSARPRQDTDLWIPAKRSPGSPLQSTPGPVPGTVPFPGKRKASDKRNLPYFRIWKSLTYSNRLRPALRRLYKGNLNAKARDRHFKT
ncbi:hypothetical protein F2Q69_00007547 [Brassica cretica]|uniref:Uncharacterized protein n=1 Tax=Brassica cretica TaxID=69181 RepID=A0A8S9NU60_BRACR|nr:hypothetical protein F2Q69_00007547 [Brassica cretica]